jgi:TPR repeat protein
MYFLGLASARGVIGSNPNFEDAAKWFRIAAEAGEPNAMDCLASAHAKGRGTNADLVSVVVWLRRASSQNHPRTFSSLGELYSLFDEPTLDRLALQYYSLSASNGCARGMNLAGLAHEKGRGTTNDLQAAVSWYRRGVAAGSSESQRLLDRLLGTGAMKSAVPDLFDSWHSSEPVTSPSHTYDLECIECGTLGSFGSYEAARKAGNFHTALAARADAEKFGPAGGSHITIVRE